MSDFSISLDDYAFGFILTMWNVNRGEYFVSEAGLYAFYINYVECK